MYEGFFLTAKSHLERIIKGDYSAGTDLENHLNSREQSEEFTGFAETMNLMTVKLEAREESLKQTIEDLKIKNSLLEENIAKRELLSSIFTMLMVILTAYVFSIGLLQHFPQMNNFMARSTEAVFALSALAVVMKSKLPLATFGFTIKGTLPALRESMAVTMAVFIGLLILRRTLAEHGVSEMQGPVNYGLFFSWPAWLYLPVALVQEVLTRGIFQTAIEKILAGRFQKAFAVFVSAGIFGAVHLNYSLHLAVASLFMGLIWGFLFLRHRNLIGVTVSHFLVGNIAYITGIWNFISVKNF